MDEWRVTSFGQDCLGNVTGYAVVRGFGARRVTAEGGTFVGDIYKPGSHDEAHAKATALCEKLNVEVGQEA